MTASPTRHAVRRLAGICGLALALAAGGAVTGGAMAQSAKPADVLQVVDRVNAELKLLHRSALQDVPARKKENFQSRKPRHVYQKARSTYMQLQLFRWLNGESRKELGGVPLRQITPGEVMELTETFLADLRATKSAYFVSETIEDPAKESGATPTDVFGALTYTEQLLLGLDMPATVPNDVYRLALMLLEDARKIHRAVNGGESGVDLTLTSTGKTPPDAYDAGMQVVNTLADVAESGELRISGGVVRPNRPAKITPNSVMRLMGDILADLNAVKVAAGVSEQTRMPQPQSGRTPSNVYDVLMTTNRILSEL